MRIDSNSSFHGIVVERLEVFHRLLTAREPLNPLHPRNISISELLHQLNVNIFRHLFLGRMLLDLQFVRLSVDKEIHHLQRLIAYLELSLSLRHLLFTHVCSELLDRTGDAAFCSGMGLTSPINTVEHPSKNILSFPSPPQSTRTNASCIPFAASMVTV